MKKIVILIALLIIGMFGFWGYVLKQGGNALEYDHSSNSVIHSKEKNVFVCDLYIINQDSIKIAEKVLYPIAAWIEKKPFWKSEEMDLDSLDFDRDSAIVVVNFSALKNGIAYSGSGSSIIEFNNNMNSTYQLTYPLNNKNIFQTEFTIPNSRIKDTIEIISRDRKIKINLVGNR